MADVRDLDVQLPAGAVRPYSPTMLSFFRWLVWLAPDSCRLVGDTEPCTSPRGCWATEHLERQRRHRAKVVSRALQGSGR